MPTYTYHCPACDRNFDVFQSMKDEPLRSCDVCGAAVQRMIGAGAGIVFKGSGFYVTDYRKSEPSSTTNAAAEKSGPAPSSSSGTEKATAAPASGKSD
ncbi:MAG: zinc ribbon domain-containing protein [Spirochaetales bacterium]|nr:zinc ribbon domain-containing protein [Spirochaetales bacterium]